METFLTVIILSLGIAGPLLAAMNFVDTLAQVGTTVAAVDEMCIRDRYTQCLVRQPLINT